MTPPRLGRRRDRRDGGGVWIATGIVLGGLAYVAVLLMLVAGYTSVLPVVVVPPVLIGLIGAGNLLGGRTTPRGPARPISDLHASAPPPSTGTAKPGAPPPGSP